MLWCEQAGVVISAVEMCFEYFLIDQIFSAVSSVTRLHTRSVRTFLSSLSRVTVIRISRYPLIDTQDSGWLLAAPLPPPRLICIPSLCQDTAEGRAFTQEQRSCQQCGDKIGDGNCISPSRSPSYVIHCCLHSSRLLTDPSGVTKAGTHRENICCSDKRSHKSEISVQSLVSLALLC